MRRIPLNLLTLYADLAQNAPATSFEHGSVVTRIKRGKAYLYVVSKDGGRRVERYIGPAGDPAAGAEADELRRAAALARARRTAVSALKQARIPAPSLALGRVLEAIANAGLFRRGVVLIGTAAYQTYACPLGSYLAAAATLTNDADLLVASFVARDEPQDLEAILQHADPSFRAQFHAEDQRPRAFRAGNGFQVGILTKLGRGRKSPVQIEGLGCAAEALPFMEHLAEESEEAIALYGAGVVVRVPPPARFAMHKLLVAQKRGGRFLAKRQKDLAQAAELLDILMETDEAALLDQLEAVRARGTAWRSALDASLRELSRDTRPGHLPILRQGRP